MANESIALVTDDLLLKLLETNVILSSVVNMLSVSYKSKHTVDSDNEVNLTQDGYALVDYRVTLTPADSNWHAAFTVNNLLDEDYEVYLTKIPLIAGAYANGVHQSKRRINFEVGFNF